MMVCPELTIIDVEAEFRCLVIKISPAVAPKRESSSETFTRMASLAITIGVICIVIPAVTESVEMIEELSFDVFTRTN